MSEITNKPANWASMEKTAISFGTLAWIPAIASAALDIGLNVYYLVRWLGYYTVMLGIYFSSSPISTIARWSWGIAEGVVELILALVYVLKVFAPKCKARDWQFLATDTIFSPKLPKMLLIAILLEVFSGYYFGGVFVIVVFIVIYVAAPVTNPWKGGVSPAKATIETTSRSEPAIATPTERSTTMPATPQMVIKKTKTTKGGQVIETTVTAPSTSTTAANNTASSVVPVGGTKLKEVPIARMFYGTNVSGIVGKIVLMTDGVVFTSNKKEVFSFKIDDILSITPGAKPSFMIVLLKNGTSRTFKLMGAGDWIAQINNSIRAKAGSSQDVPLTLLERQEPKQISASEKYEQEQAEVRKRAAAIENTRMEKLKKLVKVSEKVKVSQMAQILNMDEAALYDRILDWAAEFGFTLIEDVVRFSGGRKDDFIASLDKAYTDWDEKSATKDGKFE